MQKTFKTLEEQVSIMQGKGLIITNTKEAEDILLRENYFFFNGYRMLFMESASNKKFIEGTTFEEVYAMFQFDRHMRNIIFKNLLIIENKFKSLPDKKQLERYEVVCQEKKNKKDKG